MILVWPFLSSFASKLPHLGISQLTSSRDDNNTVKNVVYN